MAAACLGHTELLPVERTAPDHDAVFPHVEVAVPSHRICLVLLWCFQPVVSLTAEEETQGSGGGRARVPNNRFPAAVPPAWLRQAARPLFLQTLLACSAPACGAPLAEGLEISGVAHHQPLMSFPFTTSKPVRASAVLRISMKVGLPFMCRELLLAASPSPGLCPRHPNLSKTITVWLPPAKTVPNINTLLSKVGKWPS